ncbi:MAG: amphi-Trp domain-containing protein [Roseibium sp.]|uniref:amphi-Trp domain-containing protein n=1 Tax=Roseibium sp. TaxID=1936156 RepID=UPI001B24149C|nr:amphi-Trp domain-containing protein [Roseibium sp.]MBO6892688.1 amphi-Trp domain-containing protein [Roseibium sp.]MBO6928927.1 amphi-Trp domain-containing protein [Roseibium sp.]
MHNGDGTFRHESIQSRKSIKALLEAVTKGIGKGELTLGDGEDELVLAPDGLITLRVRAERSNGSNRIDLRMTWTEAAEAPRQKADLKVR